MKKTYLILFITLLITEIAIAVFLNSGFIRYTVGDFLAVIMIFCFLKSVTKAKTIHIALFTLVLAFGIEFLQLADILGSLNLKDNKILTIILGSHFSIQDLMAYTLGIITILIIDFLYITHEYY